MAWSADGKVASGSGDKTIKIWNTNTGQCVSTQTGDRGILCLSFSPNSNFLAAGDYGGKIRLYDAATGEVNSNLSVDSLTCVVLSISYSPAGDMIAAGCSNGKIHFLDAVTVAVKRSLKGHT